jgi:hypothetical protein
MDEFIEIDNNTYRVGQIESLDAVLARGLRMGHVMKENGFIARGFAVNNGYAFHSCWKSKAGKWFSAFDVLEGIDKQSYSDKL